MDDLGIFEAWRHWRSGTLASDSTLWHVRIFWWGRIGAILQFIGGVLVVAEIVGTDRLRDFGRSLHGVLGVAAVRKLFGETVAWYGATYRAARYIFVDSWAERDRPKEKTLFAPVLWNWFFAVDLLISLLLAALLILTLRVIPTALAEVYFLGFWGFLAFTIGPALTFVAVVTLLAVGMAIDMAFIEPFAWLLEHPYLEKIIKTASLLLLLVGFHFDLLAS